MTQEEQEILYECKCGKLKPKNENCVHYKGNCCNDNAIGPPFIIESNTRIIGLNKQDSFIISTKKQRIPRKLKKRIKKNRRKYCELLGIAFIKATRKPLGQVPLTYFIDNTKFDKTTEEEFTWKICK